MWGCPDSQEVGLEAAILKRKRNSSLVKWTCAENVRGLKPPTEARDNVYSTEYIDYGRGAFSSAEKGDREVVVERTEVKMPA